MANPILVTGASGQLGRLVLEELLETRQVPAEMIIATTRRRRMRWFLTPAAFVK